MTNCQCWYIGAHLVFVAIVGLVESFSKPMQLPEPRHHPHALEVSQRSSVPTTLRESSRDKSSYLTNVLDTFADVGLAFSLLGVAGLDEDGGVGIQSQFHHLPADERQVSQVPQQLQYLWSHDIHVTSSASHVSQWQLTFVAVFPERSSLPIFPMSSRSFSR